MAETTTAPRGMKGVWHVRMGAGAAWRKSVWGEFLSEYLGTFTLIAFGDGVVAMAVSALNQSGRAATDPHANTSAPILTSCTTLDHRRFHLNG